MLTRDEYIHLRNILEDRINEQHELFLDLTESGPATASTTSVIETLMASISKNVGILTKLCDLTGTGSDYNSEWLTDLADRKQAWLNVTHHVQQPNTGVLQAVFSRFFARAL